MGVSAPALLFVGAGVILLGAGLKSRAAATDEIDAWPAPHFPPSELFHADRPPPADIWPELALTAELAERIRRRAGVPLDVISGFRPAWYDRRRGTTVARNGGVSQHWLGGALDIATPAAWTVRRFAALIDQMQRNGELPPGGLGRYPEGGNLDAPGAGFIHFDRRGHLSRWDGVA